MRGMRVKKTAVILGVKYASIHSLTKRREEKKILMGRNFYLINKCMSNY